MALETGNRIADLVPTNPVGATDFVSQGDDHLRLVKACIQGSFPSLGSTAVARTAEEINGIKDASNLNTGTLPDARLSSNVPLKNAANTFTATQSITAGSGQGALLDLAGAGGSAGTRSYFGDFGDGLYIWQRANVAMFFGTNDALRVTLSAAGNVTINAPSSGAALGVIGAPGAWTAEVVGNSTGDGLFLQSGSTGAHVPLLVRNAAGSLVVIDARADGSVAFGSPTGGHKGAGTLNTAGVIYQNNVAVALSTDLSALNASNLSTGTVNNARLPATINVTALQQGSVGVQSLPLVTSTSTTLAKGQMHHISGTATIPSLSNGEWVSVVNTSGSAITINKVSASTSYWSAAGTSISSSISLGPRGRLFVSSNGSAYFFSGDIVGSS